VYNLFDESSHPTVGIDFISKTIETEEHKKVRLQLWDTAG
jgi:Ras-related protein Rab-6A